MCALQAWKSAGERLEVSAALYTAEDSMKGTGQTSCRVSASRDRQIDREKLAD